jgi:hypothetical protein
MTLGRDFRAPVPSENEIGSRSVKVIQVLLEHRFSEGIDFFQSVCVNKYSLYLGPVLSEHAEQLLSGTAVKIALQAEMQTVAVPVNQDSEIAGHW